MRAQYRWAYATSTLIPLQENGQNQHEKGGWAFNTSWVYNTYSTVYTDLLSGRGCCRPAKTGVGGATAVFGAVQRRLEDRETVGVAV